MPRRTTIIPDDNVYEGLARKRARVYGGVLALFRLVNDFFRRALGKGVKEELKRLLSSKKHAHVTAGEFEELRRELSRKLEA